MEPDYSNREIDRFMKDIIDTLNRIETQTMKTNGRVNSLEQWRYYQTGAISVLALLLTAVIIPVIMKNL